MSITLFIDESGDHSLKSLDKQSSIFVLCGCIIDDGDLSGIEENINAFKLKYFGSTDVILHYREIRKREGCFCMLSDKQKNEEFINELNGILSSSKIKILLSVIDKPKHIESYGRVADDPYHISLNFIIERFIFTISGSAKQTKIYAEKRGQKEDALLLRQWIKIYQRGAGYIGSPELQRKIMEFKTLNKLDNIIGLQVADIIVSSIARKILKPEWPEDTFDAIKDKIYVKKGICLGVGIKIFPENSTFKKTISSLLGA